MNIKRFKNNRKLFLILSLLFVSLLLNLFFLRNIQKDKGVGILEETVFWGKVVSLEKNFFELQTEEDIYTVNFDFDVDFENNDFVSLTGFLNKKGSINAKNWHKSINL